MTHDQNFKNLILDFPRQALAFFASEETHGIDAEARIVPVRQEQLKERLGDRFRELDVPLLVEWPDGRREAVLFVIEEESDPSRFSIHRLAHYCLDLAELLKTDRVVPVVVFLRGGCGRTELVLGGERHTYLSFRYLGCALAELPFERYRDSDNIVERLNLPNMRYAREQRIEVYAHAVRGLTTLEPDLEKQIKYLEFIDIYSGLDDNELARYQQEYPEEAETMSTFAERFIQQGRQEGWREGWREGKREGKQESKREGEQEGEARILIRLLRRKFGDVPEAIRRRIESADADTLLEWADHLLTARRLEDVVR